jgi:hypothetical protein
MNQIIHNIMKDMFMDDILKTLNEHYPKYEGRITKDEFNHFCKEALGNMDDVDTILQVIPGTNHWLPNKKKYISRKPYESKPNKCKCRIWNNGYGGQCSNRIKQDNLCKRHFNMYHRDHVLPFGWIDEPLPPKNLKTKDTLCWILNSSHETI